MVFFYITLFSILFLLLILFIRGNRVLKTRENALNSFLKKFNEKVEVRVRIAYHGGFVEIPKLQKLTIVVGNSMLFLLTDKGQIGILQFDKILTIDKFTTKRKLDNSRPSILIWGPLLTMKSQNQLRHFIVIEYLYENKDNRILIECEDLEQTNEIFAKLKLKWKLK